MNRSHLSTKNLPPEGADAAARTEPRGPQSSFLQKIKPGPVALGVLILVLALGVWLRVDRIGAESLWLDEAFSVQIAQQSLSGITAEVTKDVHPPLYFYALRYWLKIFGASETAARMLSALFAILTLFGMYQLAAHLFDRMTGILSALLLALSPLNIAMAQEARMYALLGLLALASMWCMVRLLESPRRVWLGAYVVVTALLLYTQVYGFFIVAAQNIFVLSLVFVGRDLFRRNVVRWMFAQILSFTLFLPWLNVLVQQLTRVRHGFWIPRPELSQMGDTLANYAGAPRLIWLALPLIVMGLLLRPHERRPDSGVEIEPGPDAEVPLAFPLKNYLLLLWLACPVLLPFLISQFSTPIYQVKYTLPASLAFLILLARGLRALHFARLQMALLIVLVFGTWQNLQAFRSVPHKDNWRAAAAFFDARAEVQDAVLFNLQSGLIPFNYYSRRADVIKEPFPNYQDQLRLDNVAELVRKSVAGRRRVWVVLTQQHELSPYIAQYFGEWGQMRAHMMEQGVEVYLFESR